VIFPIAAAVLAAQATPADIATVPAQFIGRYEAEARHCRVPLKVRDDDEASEGQGGALVLVDKRAVHFVQWDWPVKSVTPVAKDAVSLELINDVDADGKKIEIVRYELKLRGKFLIMTDHRHAAQYYRCNYGS